MSIKQVLYRAQATATGGREGRAVSSDNVLDVKLTTPKNWAAMVPWAPIRNNCSPPATRPASSAP